MKKWITIVVICALVIGVGVTGVLLFQNMNNLKTAKSEVATQKNTITGLETDLTSSKAETSGLETDLTSSKTETAGLETKLTASQAEVTTLKENVADLTTKNTKLDSDLKVINSQLSTAQTANLALTQDLKKVRDPRHFTSVTELKDWLQKDDTNTKYASSRAAEISFILQVRALRDGFLLPAAYWADSAGTYFYNLAVIDGTIYNVFPFSDSI